MARRNRTHTSRAARELAAAEGISYQQAHNKLRGTTARPAELPTTIWLLTIEHRHGSDSYAHTEERLVWDSLSTYLDSWWSSDDGPRDDDGQPLPRPEDIHEAVDAYFWENETEFYSIQQLPLIGQPTAGAAAVTDRSTAKNAGIPYAYPAETCWTTDCGADGSICNCGKVHCPEHKPEGIAHLTFPTASTVQAHFQPQAWMADHAVDVDDEGPDTWYVSLDMAEVLASPDPDLDLLKDDPLAPDWIRDWDGPFTISLRCPACGRDNTTAVNSNGIPTCAAC